VNSPATDLAKLLEAHGLGSMGLGTTGPGAGVGIFVGDEPPEPNECITLYSTPGTVQDTLTCEGIDDFRVQVRCRARSYQAAWDMALSVEAVLDKRKDYNVNDGTLTVWYIVIIRRDMVSELGKDGKHRSIMVQNYTGLRQRL
jgi:hypothetical protein